MAKLAQSDRRGWSIACRLPRTSNKLLRFLVQRPASEMYDALSFDSAHPCHSWVVEDEPHIPSYLYMAANQECISPE